MGVAVDDGLVSTKEFMDYMKANIKINEKKGELSDDMIITMVGNKQVLFTSRVQMSKRYIKYLTKKYFKKIGILEYLKVYASEKRTYKVKYIAVENKAN